MVQQNTVYDKEVTATNDLPFQVDNVESNILTSVNIHCYDFDVNYGNVAGQHGTIPANSVVWFDGFIKVSDYWFKNVTPGSNGRVAIVGARKR